MLEITPHTILDIPGVTALRRMDGKDDTIILIFRQALLEKEQEKKQSLQLKIALSEIQKFFIKESIAVLEKHINDKNCTDGAVSRAKVPEFSKQPDYISLSSYLQCESNIASSLFSLWMFFNRFESVLSIDLPDLKDFGLGLLVYSGEKGLVLERQQEYYLDIVSTLGIRLVSFLLANEADLPVLFDEAQAVNHIISCHEALLKFIVNFDYVRSRVDCNNWTFILLAILLLHSPSQTSLFDQSITDLCSVFLSSDDASPPLFSLLTLLKEATNLASLTNSIRDSLIFSVNPVTGEIVSRGRPKATSFASFLLFMCRKKNFSAVERFRAELNQISYSVENPYSLKKRATQQNEEQISKNQRIWLLRLVHECLKFLPRFVNGNLSELAKTIGLESHPIVMKLQSALEQCRVQQSEENQNASRVLELRGLRRLQPTFISRKKKYYFLPRDKDHVYFTVSGKQVSPLLSEGCPFYNRLRLDCV